MKCSLSLLLSMLGVVALASYGVAANYASYTIDVESNDSRGQFLYRQHCRTACHDGEHGDGPTLSPMNKLMEEWVNISENVGDIPCLSKWPQDISNDDMNDIFSYLYMGAADSPSPVT